MLADQQKGSVGISLVELLVAVTLLSIVSIAALQLMGVVDRAMLGSQGDLLKQQKSDAVISYIYKDFSSGSLDDAELSKIYTNDSMPDDLRNDTSVTIVTLFGKTNRLDGVDPRCQLTSDADLASGSFKLKADCMTRGGQSIMVHMNTLIDKGITLTTGLEGGSGRCSISQPIVIDTLSGIATIKVDDPACLASGTDRLRGVPAGNQVLLPRYVAYDTARPTLFHTSMIEPPDLIAAGIGLDMPDSETVTGGAIPNLVPFVDIFADNATDTGTLVLKTGKEMAKLFVDTVPATVTSAGSNTQKLKLVGPISDIRGALQTLHYVSPSGFFGSDTIMGQFASGTEVKEDITNLDVALNCGNETCNGKPLTGLRFDLGKLDPNTGEFKVHKYITSVSMCGDMMPSRFFGYCRKGYIFDQDSGLKRDTMTPPCIDHPVFANNPAAAKKMPEFPFVRKSPSFRDFHRADHVTVYLYEQFKGNKSAVPPKGNNALTNNRFTLFFVFDTVDQTRGEVKFTLSNIRPGRNLRDLDDPFTMSDDPTDFMPGIIETDGTLRTDSSWGIAHDGGVIPLGLPDSALDNTTGFFELKHYADGNPRLILQNWLGLQGWNIRATDAKAKKVTWQRVPFDNTTSSPKTDFQLVISESKRCPK